MHLSDPKCPKSQNDSLILIPHPLGRERVLVTLAKILVTLMIWGGICMCQSGCSVSTVI